MCSEKSHQQKFFIDQEYYKPAHFQPGKKVSSGFFWILQTFTIHCITRVRSQMVYCFTT